MLQYRYYMSGSMENRNITGIFIILNEVNDGFFIDKSVHQRQK